MVGWLRGAAACGLLSAALLAVTPAAPVTAMTAVRAEELVGLPLAEALSRLREAGLVIVFTDRLVRPEMTVGADAAAAAARAGEERAALDALLAPHGLRAQQGDDGTLVVVPALAALPPAPERSITGVVRAQESRAALAGAVVRVLETAAEAVTAADGRFAFEGLAPGRYTLRVSHWGFLDQEVPAVSVVPRRPVRLDVTLQPELFVQDEIAVRPSRYSLFSSDPALPLSFGRSEIESLPQLGGDLFRALPLLPGVTANDITAQFHLHGGRRDEVQILLDGQELYDAHHLQDFDSSLSFITTDELDRVSLSTGGFAAPHGDRMGGVLDMTTAEPAPRRSTRLTLSLLSVQAAGSGTFRPAADGEPRGSWLASGRRGATDLAGKVLGLENPAFWDLFAKVGYRLGERQQLRFHLLQTGDALDFQDSPNGETKDWRTDYDSSYLWLTHQAVLGDRLLAETRLSWNRGTRDRRGDEIEQEGFFAVDDERHFEVVQLAQSWDWQLSARHSLNVGGGVRRYDADYDYSKAVESGIEILPAADSVDLEIASSQRSTRLLDRLRGEHYELFASDRFSPLAALSVEVGARLDRHTLTGDDLLSPRINLAWRLGGGGVLRASWGYFFQSHRPNELEVADGETTLSPAERAQHWVLGYERSLGGERSPFTALRVEAYHREVRDPRPRYERLFEVFSTFPETEPDRVRITPRSHRARGIELLLRGTAGERIDWWLSYGYSSAQDRLGARPDERWAPRSVDQPQALALNLRRRLGRSWNLALAWRYHSGWPTTPVAIVSAPGEVENAAEVDGADALAQHFQLGSFNSERLSIYHRLDLRLSRGWQVPSGRLLFFVDIQNLYDRKNVAGFDLAVEEGELTINEENWPGLFPSLGISWSF